MEHFIERTEVLLLIAAIVSMIARRLRLPYTIGLLAAGIGIALTPLTPGFSLTKELLFTAFLPPLIFEAAFQMPWKGVRRDLPVTLTLATAGVALSSGVVAVGSRYLLQWPWEVAILFGVLISATDPVSVIATFKANRVHGRLGLLVEAESLFNDGTAAVLFGVALAAIGGGAPNPVGIVGQFLITVFGGVLCGLAVGGFTLLLAGRTDDHLVEITFTTIAAFGSFLLAEQFHLSGVLATLTAGLLLGNVGPLGAITDRGREAVLSFWEYAGFVANSLIFLLIGMPLAHRDFLTTGSAIGVAILLVLIGRALAVYGGSALFHRAGELRVSPAHQHILFWGGLRGALAFALALALPETVPLRDTITTVTFGVVAFSIVVQGLTMTPLLKRLGAIGTPPGPQAGPQGETD
ncbi:MAG: sodium:proton antiporter [Capsulimonadales bacterium]|nr:sodium:proton antiporter [Capsulimonadales bacterium]